MTCQEIEPELVAYHFGLAEDRARIEAHLVSCGACLRAYLETKRALEDAEAATEEAPRPTSAARERLRSAVAKAVGASTGAPARAPRWHRPFALALAASVVLFAGQASRALLSAPGAPPYARSAGHAR